MKSPSMTKMIGILGSHDSPYVKRLLSAASGFPDLTVRCFGFHELAVELSDCVLPGAAIEGLDAILVRAMPLGTLEQVIFRMDCLQVLEQAGTVVVNRPKCLEISIDKWLTLDRIRTHGVPVPRTVACQTREIALLAFEELGQDVVVKPLFGGEGRGIVRVQDKDMAWRVFSTLQQMGSVMYVQQFQPHMGYDIRVLFLGDRVYSIKRYSAESCWRTNLALGGRAESHELTDQQMEIARRSVQAVGGHIVGVDLLPCRDGQVRVLEVNAVPGWKGVEQILNVDISGSILRYVSELIGSQANAAT